MDSTGHSIEDSSKHTVVWRARHTVGEGTTWLGMHITALPHPCSCGEWTITKAQGHRTQDTGHWKKDTGDRKKDTGQRGIGHRTQDKPLTLHHREHLGFMITSCGSTIGAAGLHLSPSGGIVSNIQQGDQPASQPASQHDPAIITAMLHSSPNHGGVKHGI